jgi:putative sigma-54 modulation protein
VKPPSQRRIVRRQTYLSVPLGTLDAVDDLLSMDLEFALRARADARGRDRHLQGDGRFGLLFPERSPLADEDDIVVPKTSRYPGLLELSAARIEMDFLEYGFLYFLDAEDKRGKVIYLRHDGDYGLVEPA